MFDWLPDVIREVRNDLISLYWSFLVIAMLLVIIFEFFKFSEKRLDVVGILRRVVVSVVLLWSFEDVLGLITFITDGVVERMGGVAGLQGLLKELGKDYEEATLDLFDFRGMILYALNVLCYLVALLGYYVTEVLIHFVYATLYVLSPLMILAFVFESTSYVTKNLYMGIFHVSLWKVLWSLLGVLLLNLANVPEDGTWGGFFMQALFNIFVGLSMLLIPLFARSLIGDGLVGAASGAAGFATLPVANMIKKLPGKVLKHGLKKASSARKRWPQKKGLTKGRNIFSGRSLFSFGKNAAKKKLKKGEENKKMTRLKSGGKRKMRRKTKKARRIKLKARNGKTTKKRGRF